MYGQMIPKYYQSSINKSKRKEFPMDKNRVWSSERRYKLHTDTFKIFEKRNHFFKEDTKM